MADDAEALEAMLRNEMASQGNMKMNLDALDDDSDGYSDDFDASRSVAEEISPRQSPREILEMQSNYKARPAKQKREVGDPYDAMKGRKHSTGPSGPRSSSPEAATKRVVSTTYTTHTVTSQVQGSPGASITTSSKHVEQHSSHASGAQANGALASARSHHSAASGHSGEASAAEPAVHRRTRMIRRQDSDGSTGSPIVPRGHRSSKVSPAIHRAAELDRLAAENKQLQDRVAQFRQRLAVAERAAESIKDKVALEAAQDDSDDEEDKLYVIQLKIDETVGEIADVKKRLRVIVKENLHLSEQADSGMETSVVHQVKELRSQVRHLNKRIKRQEAENQGLRDINAHQAESLDAVMVDAHAQRCREMAEEMREAAAEARVIEIETRKAIKRLARDSRKVRQVQEANMKLASAVRRAEGRKLGLGAGAPSLVKVERSIEKRRQKLTERLQTLRESVDSYHHFLDQEAAKHETHLAKVERMTRVFESRVEECQQRLEETHVKRDACLARLEALQGRSQHSHTSGSQTARKHSSAAKQPKKLRAGSTSPKSQPEPRAGRRRSSGREGSSLPQAGSGRGQQRQYQPRSRPKRSSQSGIPMVKGVRQAGQGKNAKVKKLANAYGVEQRSGLPQPKGSRLRAKPPTSASKKKRRRSGAGGGRKSAASRRRSEAAAAAAAEAAEAGAGTVGSVGKLPPVSPMTTAEGELAAVAPAEASSAPVPAPPSGPAPSHRAPRQSSASTRKEGKAEEEEEEEEEGGKERGESDYSSDYSSDEEQKPATASSAGKAGEASETKAQVAKAEAGSQRPPSELGVAEPDDFAPDSKVMPSFGSINLALAGAFDSDSDSQKQGPKTPQDRSRSNSEAEPEPDDNRSVARSVADSYSDDSDDFDNLV